MAMIFRCDRCLGYENEVGKQAATITIEVAPRGELRVEDLPKKFGLCEGCLNAMRDAATNVVRRNTKELPP